MPTTSILSKKYFNSEAEAFNHVEKILWPEGPVCPHCGTINQAGKLKGVKDKKGNVRLGLWKCYACNSQFTVRIGTVFESAHIPLSKMLQAVYLMSCSKKGVSAHQLHRILQVTYKTAWFLAHRIREAMRTGGLAPMGGPGSIVEADETYFGPTEEKTSLGRHGPANKRAVLTLVKRGGEVRSFHIDKANSATVEAIVTANVKKETVLSTDESRLYDKVGKKLAGHMTVHHASGQYVKGDAHSNTVEGYFSIFKRGMKGVYQHCSEKHLHRYLAEFDFRYNNRVALGIDDQRRASNALAGITGKRLTYKPPISV